MGERDERGENATQKKHVPSYAKTFIHMNLKCSLWSMTLIKVTDKIY